MVENEIVISLAIANEEELSEIEDSKDDEKISQFSIENNLELEFSKHLINAYKLSLSKLKNILEAFCIDRKYQNISNLPFIANSAFANEYPGKLNIDKLLITGYLQTYYNENHQKIYLNNFNDRIIYFKSKYEKSMSNTDIINAYMQFIYSTLEYYIMPLVNIGLEIKEKYPDWHFGKNVIESLEDCKNKYYTRTYGRLNIDDLSDRHKLIISAMKDYGMTSIIKNLNEAILHEIESCLNVRYSTIDVLRAINYLANNSDKNRDFYLEIKKKYMV